MDMSGAEPGAGEVEGHLAVSVGGAFHPATRSGRMTANPRENLRVPRPRLILI